jgi:hypothetical protein
MAPHLTTAAGYAFSVAPLVSTQPLPSHSLETASPRTLGPQLTWIDAFDVPVPPAGMAFAPLDHRPRYLRTDAVGVGLEAPIPLPRAVSALSRVLRAEVLGPTVDDAEAARRIRLPPARVARPVRPVAWAPGPVDGHPSNSRSGAVGVLGTPIPPLHMAVPLAVARVVGLEGIRQTGGDAACS